MKGSVGQLALCIGICILVAFAGGMFTPEPGSEWYYQVLNKPSWNPLDWLFPPVWTALFVMMGVALWMVVRDGFERPGVKGAVVAFAVQLVLNLGWSATFFGLQSPFLGFIEILLLWLAIVTTIIRFNAVSRNAALLLVPYLLWVSFASYLNFTIWQLNP
ncbi:tryptophan-rich sensory protein [Prosthecochloris sp. ZM_2]|uniref:TspO/MBR family protein n=1 Tax=Prosthecochloris sp. ZM_2 TaxID=2045206 RepID=UPI000DF78819|nr:TspO/MBR family protein [Prosthecochloris sp. ZM_2]RNA64398.1 tryptophan-rich sensory protein [Prosthecochloris sp. ZM_2]